MKAIRINFVEPNDKSFNMTLDVIVDNNDRARPGMPFCGWWGILNSNDVSPIVVLPDGRVDFGSDEDTDKEDRFGKLNLHGKKLEPGEIVTYTDSEQEVLLRVGKSVNLLE